MLCEKIHVLDRVTVDIDLIPENERRCTTGIVTSITTRFPMSPELTKIQYEVRFDEPYIKSGKALFKNIHSTFVREDQIKKLLADPK